MARLIAIVGLLAGCGRSRAADEPVGAELIGTAAPGWDLTEWIGSPPLGWPSLRGKVLLVRWFTDTDCPYCGATAPALNQLHRDYASRGLVVVGMYHHKRPDPLDLGKVRAWIRDYGFKFPVAIDRDWRTLKRWWLAAGKRDFTSVSFLVDRGGFIRRIHPGGTLAPGSTDFVAMRSTIEELLAHPGIQQEAKARKMNPIMSLYRLTAPSIDMQPQSLSAWNGKVSLVVNTASECGNTPQYAGLEQLWRQYRDRDFAVLGFPSNDFGSQEPSSEAEIKKFCDLNYRVTFPMFAKVRTKGEGQSPIYQFLTLKHARPRWNFHKYLVGRDGQVIRAFDDKIEPDAPLLRAAIESALQQK